MSYYTVTNCLDSEDDGIVGRPTQYITLDDALSEMKKDVDGTYHLLKIQGRCGHYLAKTIILRQHKHEANLIVGIIRVTALEVEDPQHLLS